MLFRRTQPQCTGDQAGNQFSSHARHDNVVGFLRSEAVEPIGEAGRDKSVYIVFLNVLLCALQRSLSYVRRYSGTDLSHLCQPDGQIPVICTDISQTAALPHH